LEILEELVQKLMVHITVIVTCFIRTFCQPSALELQKRSLSCRMVL